MATVDGFALTSWDAATATSLPSRLHDAPPGALARETALWSSCDVETDRRRPVAPVAAPGAPAPGRRRWRRAAGGRSRPPNSSSSSSPTPTRRPGTRATARSRPPTSTTSTTRSRGPRGSSRCSGGSAARCAARAWQVESVKGECNLGQHEIAFRYADARGQGRRAQRLTSSAPRRSPPRRAAASRSWRSTTSARATRATSTSRCATTSDAPVFAGDGAHGFSPSLRALPRRARSRTRASCSLLLAPNINSYKRFVARLVRPDGAAVGPRQPHVRVPRRRPRPVAPRRVPDPGRRRQPLPRARGAGRRRAARRRRGAAARRRAFDGQRLRRATASRVPTTLARGDRRSSTQSAMARAAFGDEVVDHYVHAARVEVDGVRRRRHRLGALSEGSSDCEHDLPSHQPGHRAAARSVEMRRRSTRPTRRSREPRRARDAGARVAPADRARLLRRFAEVGRQPTSRSSPQLEVANAGHTIANARWEAGNVRDVLAYYAGAPERHPAGRSPSPAASTSRSTSRSASSGSSCRGTSRCRSPRGGSRPRSPPATRSC